MMQPLRIIPPAIHCTLQVYREGVLSRVGHDLLLRAEQISMEVGSNGSHVEAQIAADSLRVVTARRDGQDLPNALSKADIRKIEESTRSDILRARRYPTVRFRADRVEHAQDAWHLAGTLELVGTSKPYNVRVVSEGDDLVARFTVVQSQFGIEPFKALLGALRVADPIDVEWRWRHAPVELHPARWQGGAEGVSRERS